MKPAEQAQCTEFEIGGEKFYFIAKETARNYILKHTGEAIPLRELFSEKVWTPEVLKELDENVVKPKFKYSTIQDVLQEETEDFENLEDDSL
jgi:hypothetical protein